MTELRSFRKDIWPRCRWRLATIGSRKKIAEASHFFIESENIKHGYPTRLAKRRECFGNTRAAYAVKDSD